MRIFIKTLVSKDIFRKSLVFGIILLFVGVSVLQKIQSSVKADLLDSLIEYPREGDIVKNTVFIQWTAGDSEYDANLSIYLYLSNDNGDHYTPFCNNPYENTGELQWNTTQYPDGEYKLLIQAQNSEGNIGVDFCNFQIKNYAEQIVNNEPVIPNQPFGQTYGKIGREYSFTTITTDPDGDDVYYLWDWGDGNISGWIGPYYSGVNCEAKHTWTEKDNYNITVKAKDIYGKESVWSDSLSIMIPYTYQPILQFLKLLFQGFPDAFLLLRHLLGY